MKINIDIKINSYCNMNCSYCASTTNSGNMLSIDDDIMPIVSDLVDEYGEQPLNFLLLGGEITILPKGMLTELVYKLRSKLGDTPYRINIFTNLKVFSKELYELYMNDKNINLCISVDSHIDAISSRDIKYGELLKVLAMYEDMDRVVVNSTLINIRMSTYKEFVMSLYSHGVKKFKFKFERTQGFYIEKFGGKDKFINLMLDTINGTPEDIKFVNNARLNTVLSQDLISKDPGSLSVHIEMHYDELPIRTHRSVFSDIIIPDDRKFEYYI